MWTEPRDDWPLGGKLLYILLVIVIFVAWTSV